MKSKEEILKEIFDNDPLNILVDKNEQLEIMETNKLIAEFMGVVFHDDENQYYNEDGLYVGNTLQYHISWDWLMPVVEKCLNIYHIELMNDDLNFEFYDCISNKERTYKAVVEFIKELKQE
jgi:hypothetical protein